MVHRLQINSQAHTPPTGLHIALGPHLTTEFHATFEGGDVLEQTDHHLQVSIKHTSVLGRACNGILAETPAARIPPRDIKLRSHRFLLSPATLDAEGHITCADTLGCTQQGTSALHGGARETLQFQIHRMAGVVVRSGITGRPATTGTWNSYCWCRNQHRGVSAWAVEGIAHFRCAGPHGPGAGPWGPCRNGLQRRFNQRDLHAALFRLKHLGVAV